MFTDCPIIHVTFWAARREGGRKFEGGVLVGDYGICMHLEHLALYGTYM